MALDECEVVTSLGLGGLGRGQQWGVVLTCAKTVHIYTATYLHSNISTQQHIYTAIYLLST